MYSVKRLTLAAVAVALVVLAATPAHAQIGRRIPGTGGTLNPYNYYDPYGYSRQAAFNIGLYGRAMSQVPPYALGYNPYPQIVNNPTPYYPYQNPLAMGSGYGGTIVNNPSSYTSPGYSPGYSPGADAANPYTNPYSYSYADPYSGFLKGAADVINADGKFRINNQQANLVREQVRSAHLDNRRKAFDEFLYERNNMPTWLDDLERQRKFDLRYAATNASGAEILEGVSLNTLLDALKQMQAQGGPGKDLPFDKDMEDLLKQINVTAGGGVNPGLLKNEGQLTWPLALNATDFDNERKNIERNIKTAVSEVETHGRADPARLKNLNADVERMTEHLNDQIGEMTPTQYVEARNYLRFLENALKALARPDAADYLSGGKIAAKGKSVGDLVKNMSGLRFAPAVPGNELAYRKLYENFRDYYNQNKGAAPSPRGE